MIQGPDAGRGRPRLGGGSAAPQTCPTVGADLCHVCGTESTGRSTIGEPKPAPAARARSGRASAPVDRMDRPERCSAAAQPGGSPLPIGVQRSVRHRPATWSRGRRSRASPLTRTRQPRGARRAVTRAWFNPHLVRWRVRTLGVGLSIDSAPPLEPLLRDQRRRPQTLASARLRASSVVGPPRPSACWPFVRSSLIDGQRA